MIVRADFPLFPVDFESRIADLTGRKKIILFKERVMSVKEQLQYMVNVNKTVSGRLPRPLF